MTTIRLYFADERVGPKFERSATRQGELVRSAARGAAQDVADDFLERGREDIAGAGNFGSRWTEGLHAEVTEGGGSIAIRAFHDVSYFMVHQRGAVIRGNPLLWIPLSHADAADARGVLARNYQGRLFRVNRAGKAPLLLAAGSPAVPKYSGHKQVTIPKRFHVIEIARDSARKLKSFFSDRMKSAKTQ